MMLTSTSWRTDGTPPPYLSRPHPETVATFPVKSAPSGGIQIGTARKTSGKNLNFRFYLYILSALEGVLLNYSAQPTSRNIRGI